MILIFVVEKVYWELFKEFTCRSDILSSL